MNIYLSQSESAALGRALRDLPDETVTIKTDLTVITVLTGTSGKK
jgi:hypothetical protein